MLRRIGIWWERVSQPFNPPLGDHLSPWRPVDWATSSRHLLMRHLLKLFDEGKICVDMPFADFMRKFDEAGTFSRRRYLYLGAGERLDVTRHDGS